MKREVRWRPDAMTSGRIGSEFVTILLITPVIDGQRGVHGVAGFTGTLTGRDTGNKQEGVGLVLAAGH